MADKHITLHPNVDGVLDPTINIYPNIKASQNILKDDGTNMQVQEKLVSGSNIKSIKVGSNSASPQTLLGSDSIIIDLLALLYPVGTIYTCSTGATITKDNQNNPICPIQRLLGGVWQPIYDTFMYAAKKGTHVSNVHDYFPGDTGGSKDAVIVSHNHSVTWAPNGDGTHTHDVGTYKITGTFPGAGDNASSLASLCTGAFYVKAGQNKSGSYVANNGDADCLITFDSSRNSSFTGNSGTTGSAHKHNITINNPSGSVSGSDKNMPPYMCVYMWVRVS